MAITYLSSDVATSWPNGSVRDSKVKKGWSQNPITADPLAYELQYYKCIQGGKDSFGTYPDFSYRNRALNLVLGYNEAIPVTNRAIQKFQAYLGADAELGVAFAEYASAYEMVALRCATMYQGYKALRKGNFKRFTKALNVRPLEKHRKTRWTKPKDASAIWLEYWMGWAPMVGDVYSAIDVLQTQFPTIDVSVSSSTSYQSRFVFTDKFGGYKRRSIESLQGRLWVKISATVSITNPNLYLANQMGLINPAAIAWAVVPFSFMVDWFGNVGDVINDWTAYCGLTFTRPFTTRYFKGTFEREKVTYIGGPLETRMFGDYKCAYLKRTLGIAATRLDFEIPTALSQTRAATAVSLLVSLFTKG